MIAWALCAVVGANIQCLPFGSEADCMAAQAGLHAPSVAISSCGEIERATAAPYWSPTPVPRPGREV